MLDAVSDTFFIAEFKKKTIKRLFVERYSLLYTVWRAGVRRRRRTRKLLWRSSKS